MKKLERFKFIIATCMIAALSSCVQDLGGEKREKGIVGDDMALVTLSLSMPATRAAATSVENAIAEIDVLLFDETDVPNEKFIYRASGTGITDQGSDPFDAKKFEVKLPIGGTYKMVVLANARAAIQAISLPVSTIVTSGDPRVTVLNGLVKNLPAGTKMGTTNFPMWGYLDNVQILETSSSIATSIPLTRAVARVDVSVEGGVDFELTGARLYNYYNAGHVAPEAIAGGYESDLYPSGSKQVDQYLDYSTSTGFFKEEIYTFEADQGKPVTGTGWETNTCLVVGGKFGGAASPVTYYRVEFHNTTSGYLALTRNHLYHVVIDEVNAHGWPTPELAYANKPSNIVVEITAWDEGGLNKIVFNDQYQLSVDKDRVDFYAAAATRNIRASTDYPHGWTIEIPVEFDWLTVSPMTYDGSDGEEQQEIAVTVQVTGGLTRDGYFNIVAGNLEYKITVTQSTEDEFSLEVDPWELLFYKRQDNARTVYLFPVPAANIISYPLTFTVSGNVQWPGDTFGPFPTDATSIDLLPATNNTGNPLSSTVLVTLTDNASSRSITKPVTIRQLARDMEFVATPSNPYPAAAGTYAFGVMSEGKWKLAESPSDYAWLALLGNESIFHAPQPAGKPYSFTLEENMAQVATRTATIDVASSESFFLSPWATFEIIQAGYPPILEITSPAADANNKHEIDLDVTSPAVVIFDTNADWKFTGDAAYANVVASAQHNSASISPGNEKIVTPAAITPVSRSVTFTPPAVGTETLAAGTPVETVATFETVLGFPAVTDAVTLKRIVQPRFSATFAPVSGSTLPPNDASVTVTASTNAAWYVEGTDATRQEMTPATAYATGKTLILTFPSNDSSTPKNITVSTARDGGTPVTATYTQPICSITPVPGSIPTWISKEGEQVTLQFSGNHPAFEVRAIDATNPASEIQLDIQTAPALNNNTVSATLTIPANTSDAFKYIRFEYKENGTWKQITPVKQWGIGDDLYTYVATSLITPSWAGNAVFPSYTPPTGYTCYSTVGYNFTGTDVGESSNRFQSSLVNSTEYNQRWTDFRAWNTKWGKISESTPFMFFYQQVIPVGQVTGQNYNVYVYQRYLSNASTGISYNINQTLTTHTTGGKTVATGYYYLCKKN